MIYNQIPSDQEWTLPIYHELLKAEDDNFVLNNSADNEIATFMYRLEPIFIYLYFILVFVVPYCTILPLCMK